ncbi:cornifelin homolog A-like [Haliotis rufescens]|uniref:cornifelin homolog A-like n=1 Tax=Haliotis rufescens TaxID=6454 RepID=UPI001EB08DD3|nr:cornifelin homolog A-like [Haliotis rufescens]XP_046354014.1 cornifelin homolog A-like [Haliotis rufescens]
MAQGYPVVVAQPGAQGQHVLVPQKRKWSSKLCGCFEDVGTCLCGTFLGPCFMCQIASKMGENCCVPMCVPNAIITMRTALRERHNIEGSIMSDCCTSTFLGSLVACQLARELKHTGEWQIN